MRRGCRRALVARVAPLVLATSGGSFVRCVHTSAGGVLYLEKGAPPTSSTPHIAHCCERMTHFDGCFRGTRLLRRSQKVKPNPFETKSGNFDQSFERMTETIEDRLPFRDRHLSQGTIYDMPFGERSARQLRQEAADDVEGKEKESAASQQVRSYFTGEDLSPEAMGVRSLRVKVAQNPERQKYDRNILKSTNEPPEYYYKDTSQDEEQRWKRWLLLVGVCVCALLYRWS